MGCFPCCSPQHPPGSKVGNPTMNDYYNQPGMTPSNDAVMGTQPGMGPKMMSPGAMPPQHGMGRFGPY